MLLLTGCMVGPKIIRLRRRQRDGSANDVQGVADAVPETDGWKVAQPQDAMLHGKWWEIYNDPELNALEDKLTIDNQNIRQFFENFMDGADTDCAGTVAALSHGGGIAVVSGGAFVVEPDELA